MKVRQRFQFQSLAGFTLIELIVIIAIIAIIAASAFSNIGSLTSMRIRLTAQNIQSDIRYTQLLAVSIQKPTRILFNSAGDTYTVSIEDPPGTWKTAKRYLYQGDFIVTLNTGTFSGIDITGVSFNGSETGLVFDKWGIPCAGTTATPLTTNGSVQLNNSINITVRKETGSVVIS